MKFTYFALSACASILCVSCGDKPSVTERSRTNINTAEAPGPAPSGMAWIPGGEFLMGSDDRGGYKMARPTNEGPIHPVYVDGFWMDTTEVTNAEFRKFVDETGYKTIAETPFKQEDFPNAPPEALVPAGYVFYQPEAPVDIQRVRHDAWWRFSPGASWRHPQGPGSDIEGKDDYPVVCITHPDALAYAEWAGKRLPTEAEWEFAARGGLEQKTYMWGDELIPDGQFFANFWQGGFPNIDSGDDGFKGLAPVKSFPANPFGLYDMAGNVWEIVNDLYTKDYYRHSPRDNPKGPRSSPGRSSDPENPDAEGSGEFPERVIRGGSYVCSEEYCTGYRPAARMTTDDITASNHTGFRCVMDASPAGGTE